MPSLSVRADAQVAYVVTCIEGNVYTFVDFESEFSCECRCDADSDQLRRFFKYGNMQYGHRVVIEAADIVKVKLPKARENADL